MLNNSTILITGGTGSFGNRFIERILSEYNPKKIIIYSRDEFKQDLMKKNFVMKYGVEKTKKLRFFIGDVRDKERLYRAFDGVDYVIHAAAMKQVPACEYNPFEAIKTNIHGAENVIEAAIDRGVKKVVALSTDKAVNPINLYGGTKLVSDKLFISANAYSGEKGTIFSVVRYGNVAGSRGSVIPFFKQLLSQGKTELPITDIHMTRFWMVLDDAVNLVLKALKESKGGETFVFKNPSFLITELAKALNPNGIIKEVGIREGEKIHEVMITRDDAKYTYDYEDYYVIYPNFEWWNKEKIKSGGKLIPENWDYNSGTNDWWLDAKELEKRIAKLDIKY
ncbi:UDP-N-acetylglucosamine 4,6-dehydratase (inverting) [Fusobacterium nucleatum]|uniref:UDP-N-acetylglucosamine 4,6-dehydratase n=2 Tax=Fusobacterium nucleatum subsp. nucleatum TaxID=76856 RepID=Q8R6G1_FUSNN|nr:UDP-N-acetylglucosamine 4,6-dehydratase (inverting) [Fusobacterium nucleatum]AAL93804.1 UDP-N-acetylglucosamine 4,6-dehydratase [Fusobacterium nucleatum subsp. nucleatum ATCC 25586]ALF23124.1 UDP-N-acetylglucosamine 4,6-dehydratase (inverting) [Fusobacterium nucleatum subsp. nucleatum ChDC F316]ASG25565.1 UDP-N-acetylglucosamine 4,6-dehydratase (inverting) [Fusobacterium nucleatum subsp. nucleatum]AVQ14220.1 UDP-N-acetylglucosamine 4,6-dehydratase (inverting) [Fusobacterium nucleatum subsp. 